LAAGGGGDRTQSDASLNSVSQQLRRQRDITAATLRGRNL